MKKIFCVFALAFVMMSLAGCQNEGLAERTFIGMSKTDIVKELGEPDKIDELTKSTEYIFGPFESLWDQIQMGDKIVTWTYETKTGYKELYFLNDTSEVAGEFYWYNDSKKNPVF